jgi:hypothetical protein
METHAQYVPPPPDNSRWIDLLKWIVTVMDADDPDLSFVASLLHHAIDRPGLTDRQAKYAEKIRARIEGLYARGALGCQYAVPSADLANASMAGNA